MPARVRGQSSPAALRFSAPAASSFSKISSPSRQTLVILAWLSRNSALAVCPAAAAVTVQYSNRSLPGSFNSTRPALSMAPAASTWAGVRSRRHSSPRALLPPSAPAAAAMFRPISPVPGTMTPIPFLSRLALTSTQRRSGMAPRVSAALAAVRATAMGSVHPRAGTTSWWIRSRKACLDGLMRSP